MDYFALLPSGISFDMGPILAALKGEKELWIGQFGLTSSKGARVFAIGGDKQTLVQVAPLGLTFLLQGSQTERAAELLRPVLDKMPGLEVHSELGLERTPIAELLPIPESAAFAEVTDQRQDNSWQCGPAALQSVLQSFGQRVAEDDLAKELGTTPEGGTSPEAIIAVAKARGLKVRSWQGLGIAGLGLMVDMGSVVLCPIQGHGTAEAYAALESGHWVVVKGIDGGKVSYQDPSTGPGTMTADEFLARWVDRSADGKTYVRFGIAVSKQ